MQNDGIALQQAEFDALSDLVKRYQRLTMTPIVDDDYPEMRHYYEVAVRNFIDACQKNGRRGINRSEELTFQKVSSVSLERALIWHKGGLEEWSSADWSNAMAGEAGEVCNAVKKMRRIECGIQQAKGPRTLDEAIAEIAKEIGDTYLYLDLLAQRLGINMESAVRQTFNRVSEREGFPQRL